MNRTDWINKTPRTNPKYHYNECHKCHITKLVMGFEDPRFISWTCGKCCRIDGDDIILFTDGLTILKSTDPHEIIAQGSLQLHPIEIVTIATTLIPNTNKTLETL